MRLAVLEPTGRGIAANEQWMLSLIQGSITGDFNKYSAITVIDRQNLEKILAEQTHSMSGNYSESDYIRIGQLTNSRYILAGSVSKTANNYMLELSVSDTETGERKASYPPKPVSLLALENLSAIKDATADLLEQLGVRLTERGLRELKTPVNTTQIQAETNLARGIAAQRQGMEVAALSYFFQAAAFDPLLVEAKNRSSIASANISSGNIGEDARNDAQWRRDWIARLTETEQFFNNYFTNFFKTTSMPYTLVYTSDIKQVGDIKYPEETLTLGGMTTTLYHSSAWVTSVEPVFRAMQASVQAVLDGLNATGRKTAWGLNEWPSQTSFNIQSFGKTEKKFTIVVELVNSRNQVIGRQTLQTVGTYDLPVPLPERWAQSILVYEYDSKTVSFPNIKVNDITDDKLTIRIASVNGTSAETAARNGVLQILTAEEFWRQQEVAEAEARRQREEKARRRWEETAEIRREEAESRKQLEAEEAEARREQEAKKEKALREERWQASYMNTIGLSVGTTFASPGLLGTVRGTFRVFPYTFMELGLDFGFATAIPDVEYQSLYPFAHFCFLMPFIPPDKVGDCYAGVGAGWMIGKYTFSEGEVPINTAAFDFTIGVIINNGFNMSYTLRTDFKGVNHKLSVGGIYRFRKK